MTILKSPLALLALGISFAAFPGLAQTVWGPDSGLLKETIVISPVGGVAQIQKLPEIPAEGLMPFAEAADGSKFLLLRFRAEGADAVRLHFVDFNLPLGAKVQLYAGDAERGAPAVFGPFEAGGPAQSSEFWSPSVAGQEVVVEFQCGENAPGDLPFRVSEIERLDAASAEAFGLAQVNEEAPAEIRYSIYRGVPVIHEVRNGMAILEGDILMGPADQLEPATPETSKSNRHSAIAITATRYRWPGGTIPYIVDPLIPSSYRVTNAIAHWNMMLAGTVKLVPRTTEAAYVRFAYTSSASTCSSYVGRLGVAGQPVYVGNYCSAGNMIHEIGHTVGLYHEHTREDRDKYVQVNWANISSGAAGNFYQNIANADDIGPYDHGSIMHYNATSFSSNGQPTIQTIPPGIPIGQRSGLSSADVAGVKAIYSAAGAATVTVASPVPKVTVAANPADAVLGVDGVYASASREFTWTPGTIHTLSAQSPQGISTRYVFTGWSDGGAMTHTLVAPSLTSAYTAQFSKQHKISAISDPPAGGAVQISPSSTDGYYSDGAVIGLRAIASSGFCFTGWTGLLGNTPDSTSLGVSRPYALRAAFAPAAITVSPLQAMVSSTVKSEVVSVSASKGCAWTAVSTVPWIQVVKVSRFGNGSGTVTYSASPNTGPTRTGAILIGNQAVTVTQLEGR